MEQRPEPTPRPFTPGWAAPGSSNGTDGADGAVEPTIEQPAPFREAPTAETAPSYMAPSGPPAFAPPLRFEESEVLGGPPLPPLPSEDATVGRSADPTLPTSPPTYDTSPFGGHAYAPPLPPLPAYARPEEQRRRDTRSLIALVAACSALVAALVTGLLFVAFDSDGDISSVTPDSALEGSSGLDIPALLARAQPSVVTIHTDEATAARPRNAGAGTGVIITSDGDILTNAHVVARAQAVRVTLDDGREFPADVIGSFPNADVALVRARGASDLTAAQLGNSIDARVGDDVVAIGNALNLGASPSVTHGIISALDRSIDASDELTLHGLIQTDAAINPGNSGGPLLNAQGQVIGINTAIAADAQSIGFAIPIDDIKPLIEDLRQGRGEVTPDTAFLGVSSVSVGDLTVEQRDQFGISASRGGMITEVAPDSPAADGGVELGDVVTSLDGQSITSADDLVEAIRSREPGDELTIEYERNGRKREATVELDRRGG